MQKIRMLFALFISLPLILGYNSPNKFNSVVEDIQVKLKEFKSKNFYEMDDILKELDDSILDLYDQIKNYTSGNILSSNKDIADVIKRLLKITYYLPWRPCNMYRRCKN